MNPHLRPAAAGLLGLGLVLSGGCGSRKETPSQLTDLEKAFPDPKATPEVTLAVTASRSNDFGTGVIALDEAKRRPGLSAQQLEAVDLANRALVTELTRRADAGDARARAELDRIERTRSR